MRWSGLRRLEKLQLVAGEETRSRQARQNAQVSARHLVSLRATLRAVVSADAGCGDEVIHKPLPLGLSIP
jgi:predicted membrane chloride channel (bestrophin family)